MWSSISPLLTSSTLYFMLCLKFFTAHPTSSDFLHQYLLLLDLYTLSLSSHCSQEDVKSLTAHIVENYWKALEDVDYVQTFKGLKLRYEQQRERQDNPKLDRWESECCIATTTVTNEHFAFKFVSCNVILSDGRLWVRVPMYIIFLVRGCPKLPLFYQNLDKCIEEVMGRSCTI